MKTRWTSHLVQDSQEKADFKEFVLASKPVLDRLITMLTEDCNLVDMEQLDPTLYDSVNWPLQQADKIATKRAYRKIIELCKV